MAAPHGQCAFVVFNSEVARDDWLEHYRAHNLNWFWSIFYTIGDEFVLRKKTPTQRRARSKPLEIVAGEIG